MGGTCGTPDAAFGKTDGIPDGIAAYDLNNGYDWNDLPLPDNFHEFGFWDPPYDKMYRPEGMEIWRVCKRLAILHPLIYPTSWFAGARREAMVAVTFGPFKIIRCLQIFTKDLDSDIIRPTRRNFVMSKVQPATSSTPLAQLSTQDKRPSQSEKLQPAQASVHGITKTTTNVVVSKDGAFKQTIVMPPAIEALFGMTSEERFAEVKRTCQRDEVEALRAYVLPLTHWMNDISYLLNNYNEVVKALEEHFNKTGRPEAARATWGDLSLDTQTLKYIREKFGYGSDTPITWGGICHVFFNKSIRTMQRTKSYQAMLSSGETILSHKKRSGKRPIPTPAKTADDAETEALARLAIEWASQNPDHDKAQAIMKVAIDRASRLGQNIPSFETESATGVHLVEDVPTKDTASELKIALANEPDLNVVNKLLTDHYRTDAKQFGDGRITIKDLSVTVEFAGRDHRIMPGDWLEKRNGNEAATLCKCVGVADYMQRRKIKEWKDGGWSKERVIFNAGEDDYRVVTPEVARSLAPQAFPKPPSSEGL